MALIYEALTELLDAVNDGDVAAAKAAAAKIKL